MKNLILAFWVLLFCGTLSAHVINIPSDFDNIQGGINEAQNGDTVLVAPGTYSECLQFRGHDITLASHYILYQVDSLIENTIIDGGGAGSVVRVDSGQTNATMIEGFTLTNGHSTSYGGGIYCHVSSPTIYHNIIKDNYGCIGGGIGCDTAACPIISFNEIKNNVAPCNGGGIFCNNYSDAIIKSNMIIGNYAPG